MKGLIKGTTAYNMVLSDATKGRLNHAYMLHFQDSVNMRQCLLLFAAVIVGAKEGDALYNRIQNCSYIDVKVFPEEGKKYDVEVASFIVDDSLLKPMEGSTKLYVLDCFDLASERVQNKLLKVLEEPPKNVYFLLGVTSLAPILPTITSRVKKLTIPPFSPRDILGVIEKQYPNNPLNRSASLSCGGILGEAQKMVGGSWYKEVKEGAESLALAKDVKEAYLLSQKLGESKYKRELLQELYSLFFGALELIVNPDKEGYMDGSYRIKERLYSQTIVCALELIVQASEQLKFNAYFPALLYNLTLRIIEENDKWKRLSE